jgi:heptosyltransferase III
MLIGLLCPIGDTLFATPALAALRRRFPQTHITALVYRSNAGILEGNPALDARVIIDPGKPQPTLVQLARGAESLRRAPYDLMINFSPAASVVGFLAHASAQVHMDMPPLWWLVGSRDPAFRARHAVEHYIAVVRGLLTEDMPEDARRPSLYLSAAQRAAARRLLRMNGIATSEPMLALHVGGDGFRGRKRWSPDRFAAVAQELVRRFGMRVLLLGGPDDLPRSVEVANAMGGEAVVLAGATSLLVTAALIERCALFIGNDSCPLHIAAAVGTPAVGIYGPSSVQQFHPIGAPGYRYRTVHANLPCSPCFEFVGNDAPWLPNPCYSYACLKAIPAADVIEAALSLLGEERKPT